MSKEPRKILIIADWFYPGSKGGGPIRSSMNVAMALKKDYAIEVLTTDTDHGDKQPYSEIESNKWIFIDKLPGIKIYYAAKATLTIGQLKKQILHSNPDYIYLNHVWSPLFVLYPLWLHFTRQITSQVILCPRGGLYDSALTIKKYKKVPLLWIMKLMKFHKGVIFHATNQREKNAIEKYFPGDKVLIADNLPLADQPDYKGIIKEQGSLKCIFIARIVSIKNLLFFIQILQKVNNKLLLTIVGPVEEEAYWAACQKEIGSLPGNITVNYIGSKKSDELLPLLQSHHLFVLPTTGENFGHSIFESFVAGRPVLISDQTPWNGLEAKKIGWDISLNSPGDFVNALEIAAGWNQADFDERSLLSWKFANQYLKNSNAIEQYRKLFN